MSLPARLVVATRNPDKVREVRAILADLAPGVEVLPAGDWPEVAETGLTLADNALLKARAAAAASGLPALADDTGLEVDALHGAPGVHSARFAGPEGDYAANRAALLAALGGKGRRRARFRTVVALVLPGGEEVLAEGILAGEISRAERGAGGFGYDSLFEVEGQTLAEMAEDHKNRISHRARALQALARRLA